MIAHNRDLIDSVYRVFALVFLAGLAPAAAQEAESAAPAPSGEAPAPPPLAVATPVAALDCSALLDGAPSGSSVLASLAADQLERLGAFEPGPLGDYLVSELMKQVCTNAAVSTALSATCSPPAATDVRQLRARLIADDDGDTWIMWHGGIPTTATAMRWHGEGGGRISLDIPATAHEAFKALMDATGYELEIAIRKVKKP